MIPKELLAEHFAYLIMVYDLPLKKLRKLDECTGLKTSEMMSLRNKNISRTSEMHLVLHAIHLLFAEAL